MSRVNFNQVGPAAAAIHMANIRHDMGNPMPERAALAAALATGVGTEVRIGRLPRDPSVEVAFERINGLVRAGSAQFLPAQEHIMRA